jgi:hypothetical protein
VALLPSPITYSRGRRVWEAVSDLVVATALIWALPLLLGVISALATLLMNSR